MAGILSRKQLLDTKEVEKIKNKTRRIKIHGIRVDKYKSPEIYNILRGTQILSKKGYATFDDRSSSANRHALSLLDFLGTTACISGDMSSIDFSLLPNQTDATIIDNPNIEQNLAGVKPELGTLKDKFKNVEDPIYVLDNEIPYMVRAQIKAVKEEHIIPNVRLITSDLVVYNLNYATTSKLIYFK